MPSTVRRGELGNSEALDVRPAIGPRAPERAESQPFRIQAQERAARRHRRACDGRTGAEERHADQPPVPVLGRFGGNGHPAAAKHERNTGEEYGHPSRLAGEVDFFAGSRCHGCEKRSSMKTALARYFSMAAVAW